MSYPLTPVESSNIAAIAYTEATQTLVVAFRNNSVYEYYNVPEAVGEGFRLAESAGKYLWSHVRGIYEYKRVV